LCQETQEKDGTNIFFANGKNYAVSTLYPTKQEVLRIKERYKLVEWLIAKIFVYNVVGKKKVEFVCFEDK
jgi:hypothetical protein